MNPENTVWYTNVPTISYHWIRRFTGSIDEWIIHSKTPVCDSIIGDKCESNEVAVTSVYIRQCGATIPHRVPHTNVPVIIQQYIWRAVQTGFQVELTEGNQDYLEVRIEIPSIPWIQHCDKLKKTTIFIFIYYHSAICPKKFQCQYQKGKNMLNLGFYHLASWWTGD